MIVGFESPGSGPALVGVSVYSRELVGALLELEAGDEFIFFQRALRPAAGPQPLHGPHHRLVTIPLPSANPFGAVDAAYYAAALPWWIRRLGIQVFHSLSHLTPSPGPSYRVVTTIHDVFARAFPNALSPQRRKYYDAWHVRTIRRADHLIAVSETTRDDLIRHYRVPEAKVTVVPEAAHDRFRPTADTETLNEVRQRYGLSTPLLISQGTLSPRKTPALLLQAHALAQASLRARLHLALFGCSPDVVAHLRPMARHLGTEGQVSFLGPVPDADLPILYSMADLFVSTSLYDGFGLPLLESMQCGVPVIAPLQRASAEITAGAATLVSPWQADELASAIASLFCDPGRAQALRAAGLARARDFSWQRTAEATRRVYEAALGGGR